MDFQAVVEKVLDDLHLTPSEKVTRIVDAHQADLDDAVDYALDNN